MHFILKTAFVMYILIYPISDVCGKTYANYTLFKAIPVNKKQLAFLQNLSREYSEKDLLFWRKPALVNWPVEFSVSPKERESLCGSARKSGLFMTTIISDLQR